MASNDQINLELNLNLLYSLLISCIKNFTFYNHKGTDIDDKKHWKYF
jgi:hypothetical protein